MKHQDSRGVSTPRCTVKTRVLAIPMIALAMVGALVAAWAGPVAATDNRASVSESLDGAPIGTCIVTASSDGFRVDWAPSPNEDDYAIIERRVFDSFDRRGRKLSSAGSFSDGLAPKNTSKIEYRVSQVGQFRRTVTCDVASTPGMTCFQTLTESGYSVDWSGENGSEIDYVVRRRFPTAEAHRWPSPVTRNWRAETRETSFSDSVSAKGPAQYQVLARSNRRIIGSTFCDDLSQECATWRLLPAATALPADLESTGQFISETTPQGKTYAYLLFKNETKIRISYGSGSSEEILFSIDETPIPSFFATSGELLFLRLGITAETIVFDPACAFEVGEGPSWDPDGLPQDAPRPEVTGAQLWVSPAGNDANPGTEQAPLRNLQVAVNQATPGTTIQVQTGTYDRVTIAKSGRPDAWIVLTAAPGANPKIVATQGEGVRLRGAYLAVNGFTIQGVGGSDNIGGAGYGYGILATNYKAGTLTDVHHIYLTNNEVYGWSTGGIVSGWANWLVVTGNYVHHNANWGREGGSGISFLESTNAGGPPGPAGYTQWITGNTVTDNRQLVPSTLIGSNEKLDGNGIILDRLDIEGFANRTLIAHNFVANNGGRGIHAFESSEVDVVNNTLYHNGEYVNGELSAYHSDNVIFTRNLVIPRPGRSAFFGQGIDAGDNTLLDPNTDPATLANTAQTTGSGAQEVEQ